MTHLGSQAADLGTHHRPLISRQLIQIPPIDSKQAMACFVMRLSRTLHNVDRGKCLLDVVEFTKLLNSIALKGKSAYEGN